MKRKPRKMTKGIDLLKPVNIEDLGGENDPCFGKHNDPKAEECQRCGDCELCAVVQSQNLHTKRAKVEKGQKFKDLELSSIKSETPTIKDVRKEVRKYMKDLKGTFVGILDIRNELSRLGYPESLIFKGIKSLPKKYPESFTFNKSKTKLKWIS